MRAGGTKRGRRGGAVISSEVTTMSIAGVASGLATGGGVSHFSITATSMSA